MMRRMKSQMPSFMKLTEQNVRRNTILQIIIATLAFILFVRIWPMGLVKEHTFSRQQAITQADYVSADYFKKPDKKLQGVRFTGKHIYQITLYMSCAEYEKDDYVVFRLYDDNFSCIYEEEAGCNLIIKEGALIATPDMDVVPGQDYYYEILIPDYDMTWRSTMGELILPIADKVILAQEENQVLYIDGIYNDKEALVADFDYTSPLAWWKICGYLVGVVVSAVAIYCGVVFLFERFYELFEKHLRTVKYLITAGAVIMALIAFYYAVVLDTFGRTVADKVMYSVAIIAMFVMFACSIWLPNMKKILLDKRVVEQSANIWKNYLQTVSFGLLFHSLCLYVNAEREYTHIVNTRWMLIFFGLALLMIHSVKVLCNRITGIWLVISSIVSVVYCMFFTTGDAEARYVTKLSATVVVIWGLVLIHALLRVKKECWKNIYKLSFGVWALFTVLMYWWRAERVWVFTATLPFLVLLLYNLSVKERSRLLKNITKGIFVSFAIYMLYSLHHRPYNAWILFRYGGMFFTVACTGMYLVVVAGAALGRLCGQWKTRAGFLTGGWKSLCIWGISVSGILLTMSRAAMLTLAVNSVLVFGFACILYKKSLKRIAKEIILLGTALLLCFPLTYSAIRIVPAIADEPIYSQYEQGEIFREHNVFAGDATNDMEKYMSIERYFAVLLGRFQVASEQSIDNSAVTAEDTGKDIDSSVSEEGSTIEMTPSVEKGDEVYNYVVETNSDISNGRFDIYKTYFEALELKGHASTSMETVEGNKYEHAHSSYLQVAYEFGIPAGIIFLVLCALTLWNSVVTCYKYGAKYDIYIVVFSLVIVFGVISVTEWAFHPCIPVGFAFLLMQMLLMQRPAEKKGEN